MSHTPRIAPASALLGLKVRVYKNLHLDGCWYSVQHRGKVIAHVQHVTLADVTFTVQPAGRAKVLATRTKQVHAFVNGTVIAADPFTVTTGRAMYNPYKYTAFVDARTEQPLGNVQRVSISTTGLWLH